MRTRVQQRVLYSESAQVKLGGGRGRFDDKKIRVGPAYQAVIPVLGSWSNADETARAGYVQAHGPVMARTKQPHSYAYFRAKDAAKEAGATPAAAAAAGAAAAAAKKAGATPAAVGAATAAAAAAESSQRRSTRPKRTARTSGESSQLTRPDSSVGCTVPSETDCAAERTRVRNKTTGR